MTRRAGWETDGARGAGERGPITRAFDEGIEAAIPPAGEREPAGAAKSRGVIAEAFAEGIRAAIPAEGEADEAAQGDGVADEQAG